jgi:predicted alpha/beta superfamily hydrolase
MVLCAFAHLASAQSVTPLRVVSEAPGTLYRADPTVQFVVHSERVGRDFLVQVTPPAFGPWLPGQKAAVVYALDGGYGIVGPAVWLLGGSNAMLPAYVVSVSYPSGQSSTRERDMLFAPRAQRPDGSVANGGGGEAMMGFIVDELRPWVEGKYPVDRAKSVLMGHSLSALFTANVLARRSDAFAGYLIASPSVWADPQIAARLAAVRVEGPRRVFVAYGEDEAPYMVDGANQVAKAIRQNGAAFLARREVFASADHISFYPELAAKGLGYLLPRKRAIDYPIPAHVAAEVLRRYEGTYVLSDGRKLTVRLKDGRLATTLMYPVELDPLPEAGRFFVNGVDAQFTFKGPAGESASVLSIDYLGDTATARRIP